MSKACVYIVLGVLMGVVIMFIFMMGIGMGSAEGYAAYDCTNCPPQSMFREGMCARWNGKNDTRLMCDGGGGCALITNDSEIDNFGMGNPWMPCRQGCFTDNALCNMDGPGGPGCRDNLGICLADCGYS